jgi:hypothetical protein
MDWYEAPHTDRAAPTNRHSTTRGILRFQNTVLATPASPSAEKRWPIIENISPTEKWLTPTISDSNTATSISNVSTARPMRFDCNLFAFICYFMFIIVISKKDKE